MTERPRRFSRRTFLNVSISAVVAGVVAGVGSYYAGLLRAPERVVTQTFTTTVTGPERVVTKTVTETVMTTPVKRIKVAAFAGGVITDLSWNYVLYDALKTLRDRGEIEMSYSEKVALPDAERIARGYANAGYNLIFLHSAEWDLITARVAADFPKTNFMLIGVGVDTPGRPANLGLYEWVLYEAYYLAGALSALMTKTGKLGIVAPFEIPPLVASLEAYKLGAKSIKPDIKVAEAYLMTWYDPVKAQETALAMIAAGADVLMGSGSGLLIGTIKAAQMKGVYAIGTEGDMNPYAPDTVIANALWDLKPMVSEAVKMTRDGTFNRPYFMYGLAKGGSDLGPFYNVPQSIIDQIQRLKQDIINGKVKVPFIGKRTT